MSNIIYPLEKPIQDHLKNSNSDKESELSISELRAAKAIIIKAWPNTLKNVQGVLTKIIDDQSLPEIGKFIKTDSCVLICNAHGQYLLISDDEEFSVDISADDASITDISHSRCGLVLEGSNASALLNKGLAFPLDDESFPVGGFMQGSIHSIGVLILKTDKGQFSLFFYSSFAYSFFEWVIDSALEYGYALSGEAKRLI